MAEVHDVLTRDYGIQVNRITTRNPQANSIVERVHQTIGNMIRTCFVDDPELDESNPYVGLLSAVAFATRVTFHTTHNATPSQRDAMLDMELKADWTNIRNRKQKRINENNRHENAKRKAHQYSVGDQILIKTDPNRKYGQNAYKGPYQIISVNDNGTLRYQNGRIQDIVNIINATPYHELRRTIAGFTSSLYPDLNALTRTVGNWHHQSRLL